MEKPKIIEIIVNDRVGKKTRIKCSPGDTIGILKQIVAAHIGTKAEKIKLQLGYSVLNDNITLEDYEIKNGMSIELYYN
jgi:ubiquitin-like protein 5